MLKNNFKKAFTLAELMVVLAIIWILSASAMSIFSWAIAEARDSTRVTDLNTVKTSLESYYLKNRVYPQPAKQAKDNVWGYVEWKNAIATCWVATQSWEIVNTATANKCWWDIVIKEKKVNEIVCKYNFTLNSNQTTWDFTISSDTNFLDKDWNDWDLVLWNIYEFDNLKDVCTNYVSNSIKDCEESDDWSNWFSCWISTEISDIAEYFNFYKAWWDMEAVISVSSKQYSTANPKKNIIWWKWTLTQKSWVNSIHFSNEEKVKKSFYGFMQNNPLDPKYKSSKYKDYWFWYYPYSVFRDWIWQDNHWSKAYIWWTAYQIAATLEKQDKDWNYHPETLIIWNYKRPKNPDTWKIKAGYPRSLFWNWTDVIVNWQKEWEKAKYVKRPNWKSNRWIPYPVEEIQ